MDKIVISGYYGYDNLGDEAILEGIVYALRKMSERELEITVLSANPELTSSRYGVKAINRYSFREIIKVIGRADLFLSGGGSLLQDVTGWKTIPYYLGLVLLARLLGKSKAFYSQGIGPVNGYLAGKMIKWVASTAELITVRDSTSRSLLRELGVRDKKIELYTDPVFALKRPEGTGNSKQTQDRKKIGISVRPGISHKSLEVIADGVDYMAEITGAEVIIVPMHYHQDREISKELGNMLASGYRVLANHIYAPGEMIREFVDFDLFIGVRLHSLIFAALNRVPFIGISYDPKIDSFLESLNLSTPFSIENIDEKLFKNEIRELWSDREAFSFLLNKKVEEFQERALVNAARVLELLNNKDGQDD